MNALFLWYPNCETCRKAKKWLDDHGIDVCARHIKEQPPTTEELQSWLIHSKLPLKKFFNTSGQVYKAMGLKDKLSQMDQAEQIALLSQDGMLVKRPILIMNEKVLVGFRPTEWESLL